MPILQPGPKYTMTEGHMELLALLANLGFIVEEEREFPPYTVDCYIEGLHLAFEFDGPHHFGKRDERRDAILMVNYALPVLRVVSLRSPDMMAELLTEALNTWKGTAGTRRRFAAMGGI